MHISGFLRSAAAFASAVWLAAAGCFFADAASAEPPGSPPNDSPRIALTFDDGPSSASTAKILDLLEVNGAKATFFVIGRNIADHADVMLRAYRMGCEIGNHTYDHKKLSELSADGILRQLDKTADAIEGILGTRPALVRAPCGCCGKVLKVVTKSPVILWSIDTMDWSYACQKNGNTKENRDKVIRAVTENARDGDIILMHDIYAFTAQCCEEIIPSLRARGFELVTVSELMQQGGITMQSGCIYHNAR